MYMLWFDGQYESNPATENKHQKPETDPESWAMKTTQIRNLTLATMLSGNYQKVFTWYMFGI